MSKITDLLYDFYSDMQEVENQDPMYEDALNPEWKQHAEIVKEYAEKLEQVTKENNNVKVHISKNR